MNSYILGFLAVTGITVLSVLGMLGVRKRVGLVALNSYHEVAGYLLSVVGMLYAVLLGFVIVDSMNHMQDVRKLVSLEAGSLANVFLVSNGLPVEKKAIVRALCHEYAEEVINDEWKTLEHGAYSQKTFDTAFKLWKEISRFNPKSQGEIDVHQQLTIEICSMTQNHRARVISATHGVAPVLWVVLIIGGFFTIVFTYFFGVANVYVQMLMTILVVVTLTLNLSLVYTFGNPMSSDLGVRPGPFKLDLLIFDNFDSMSMPPAHPIEGNF